MLNKVDLIGRLGTDPETKVFNSGSNLTSFTLATSEYYKDKNGETQTQTEWHNITAWGKLAEYCQTLQKGERVLVIGSIKYQSWEDQNKEKKNYRTIINASKVMRLDKKQENKSQEYKTNGEIFTNTQAKSQEDDPFAGIEDDLPF